MSASSASRFLRRALYVIVIGSCVIYNRGPGWGVCYAAPLYGPDMPRRGQWYMGFETNLVFERDMRKGLGHAESDQYFCNASYGIYNWFSFDGKLGVGDTGFDTIEAGHLDFGFGFSGAYGVRFKVYNNEAKKIKAIFGFQHISAHPPKLEAGGIKHSSIWDEWQLSFLVSKDLGKIEPYLGAKASQLYIIRRDNVQNEWSWNGAKDHFGIVAGSRIDLPAVFSTAAQPDILKNWYLDVEGRFLDETAMSAALSYKL